MTLALDPVAPVAASRAASAPAPSTTGVVEWRSPESGLWIGHREGRYVGMIERSDDGFRATDGINSAVGLFLSLADAESALADRRVRNTAESRVPAVIAASSGAAALLTAVIGLTVLAR